MIPCHDDLFKKASVATYYNNCVINPEKSYRIMIWPEMTIEYKAVKRWRPSITFLESFRMLPDLAFF